MKARVVAAVMVELPHPHPDVFPNARPSRRRLGSLRKKQREFACTVALEALGGADAPRWRRATIAITWANGERRQTPDPDNALAALKASIDGLVDAGVLFDDRDPTYEPIRFEPEPCGREGRVTLTVRPAAN